MEHPEAALPHRRHSSCTPRGSSITGSGSSDGINEAPRVTAGQSKYRNPRPPRTLNRLPRGFLWSDPDEQLVDEPPDREEVKVSGRLFHVRVPENTVYLVERAGVFHRAINPGIRIFVPGLDKVAYVFSKKMQKLVFGTSNVPTSENVLLTVKGTIFYMVGDPIAAAYAVEDMKEALVDLAAAAVHDEFGRISVDAIFSDLDYIWGRIAQSINEASDSWGTRCLHFSTEINLPKDLTRTYNELVKVRLQQQVDEARAENESRLRDFRGEVGNRDLMNKSENRALVVHNDAQADADAILLKGEAHSGVIHAIADVLDRPNGRDAARVWIASKYIDALALGLRSNSGNVSIDASSPGKIVDDALNVVEHNIRSRNNSRIESRGESSVSTPSPPQADQHASPPPPGYTRPAPPSPAPESVSSQERRPRPRRVRPQGRGAGSSSTGIRDSMHDAPGSGAAYLRSKLAADPLTNLFGTLAPSHGATTMVPPTVARDEPRRTVPPTLARHEPRRTVPPTMAKDESRRTTPPAVHTNEPKRTTPLTAARDESTAMRSAGNVEGARARVKNKSGPSSRTRNIWLAHLSDPEVENLNEEADDESEDEPAIDFTLSEVRAEAVSASALAGWGGVSRRSRRPNPDVSRKTSQRAVGRAVPAKVPVKQSSNITADTDGEEAEAVTRKVTSGMPPPRPSFEFRGKRNSAASLPKRQAGRKPLSHRATGSEGENEGYTESV